jgi:hypothetical protein
MNRRILPGLVLIAILLLAPSADALPLQWGIRGGWNFDSMDAVDTGSGEVSFNMQTGYNVGLFADFGVGPIGLRPGLSYLKTGPLFSGASFVTDDQSQLSYIAVPLDVRFKLPIPGASPYLATGPELRALVGGAPTELEEQLAKYGATWGVGLGFEIGPPMGGFRFIPEVRYSMDLTGLVKDQIEIQGQPIPFEGGQKVDSWRLSLGLAF